MAADAEEAPKDTNPASLDPRVTKQLTSIDAELAELRTFGYDGSVTVSGASASRSTASHLLLTVTPPLRDGHTRKDQVRGALTEGRQ